MCIILLHCTSLSIPFPYSFIFGELSLVAQRHVVCLLGSSILQCQKHFDNLLSFVDYSSAMAMTFVAKTLWNEMLLQSCWLACLQNFSGETSAVESCCLAVGIFYTRYLYILCLYKMLLKVWPAAMYVDVLAWWSLYLWNTCICCSQYASLMFCCLV